VLSISKSSFWENNMSIRVAYASTSIWKSIILEVIGNLTRKWPFSYITALMVMKSIFETNLHSQSIIKGGSILCSDLNMIKIYFFQSFFNALKLITVHYLTSDVFCVLWINLSIFKLCDRLQDKYHLSLTIHRWGWSIGNHKYSFLPSKYCIQYINTNDD